jgi:hypothetical protein
MVFRNFFASFPHFILDFLRQASLYLGRGQGVTKQTETGEKTMKNEVSKLVDYLNAAKAASLSKLPYAQPDEGDFFIAIEGKKYIKIVQKRGGVWGFVVKKAEGKFQQGDILKASSWSSPAKNFARGNVYRSFDHFDCWGA